MTTQDDSAGARRSRKLPRQKRPECRHCCLPADGMADASSLHRESYLMGKLALAAQVLNESQASSLSMALLAFDSLLSACSGLDGLGGDLAGRAWGTQDCMDHRDCSSCVPTTTPRIAPAWSAGLAAA